MEMERRGRGAAQTDGQRASVWGRGAKGGWVGNKERQAPTPTTSKHETAQSPLKSLFFFFR